jgi:hypothetical protein
MVLGLTETSISSMNFFDHASMMKIQMNTKTLRKRGLLFLEENQESQRTASVRTPGDIRFLQIDFHLASRLHIFVLLLLKTSDPCRGSIMILPSS